MINRFKFRAFDKADGYHRDMSSMNYDVDSRCNADFIMQCTGLRDKEALKIYTNELRFVNSLIEREGENPCF